MQAPNYRPMSDYRIKFELFSVNMSRLYKQIQFCVIGDRALLGWKKIDYYNENRFEIFCIEFSFYNS
jgi:hypothetical protein